MHQHSLPELPIGGRNSAHQATGMISVQLGVTVGEAFARLRARAFADDRPLSELAIDVVTRHIRFAHDDT
jgi:AmiR/NasT family two-component response regulator